MHSAPAFHEDAMPERQRLGAKLRATRAILNLSQTEFASRVDLTQKSVHRLEQGQVDAKRATLRAIERFWRIAGLSFEDLPDGGFTISVLRATLGEVTGGEEAGAPGLAPSLDDRIPAYPVRMPS